MISFMYHGRTQGFLMSPDLCDWIWEDEFWHFIIEAGERIDTRAFKVNWRGAAKRLRPSSRWLKT